MLFLKEVENKKLSVNQTRIVLENITNNTVKSKEINNYKYHNQYNKNLKRIIQSFMYN